MRFSIAHKAAYRYSAPVFFEPHRLRLSPRGDGCQLLLRQRFRVDPVPVEQSQGLSDEGNVIRRLWFDGLHDSLDIEVELEVETTRVDPFDYRLDACGQALPLLLSPERRQHLAAYLPSPSDPRIQRLSNRIAAMAEYRTLDFLEGLNNELYEQLESVVRDEGVPRPSVNTLELGGGSCRDLAVLFVDVCHAAGVPARYVNGYQAGDHLEAHRHLHAWAEVFVPGGGWRGYDPTLGQAVADSHVALAASSLPRQTLPVDGGFRGEASCDLSVELEVTAK